MDTRKVIRRLQVPIPPVAIDADYPAVQDGDEVLKSGADYSKSEVSEVECACRYCNPGKLIISNTAPSSGIRRYDENGELVAWK